MKSKILNIIRKQAENAYKEEQFDELFLDVYLLSYVVKFLASAFSLLTGFYFLLTIFGAQIDNFMKFILSAIVVLIVESIKYYVTPKAFNNLFKRKFVYGIPSLIVSLPLYAASIFFTINGANKFFEDQNKQIEIAVDISEKKVESKVDYYDSLIKREQRKYDMLLKQHEGTRRMGWIAVIEQFNSIEGRIDQLSKDKSLESERTRNLELNKVDKVVKETNSLKDNMIYISFASESLLFLIFLFSQYYLYRSYVDSKNPLLYKNFENQISVRANIPRLGNLKIKNFNKKENPT